MFKDDGKILCCYHCDESFFELSQGYFRCENEHCDFDVCKECGSKAGLDLEGQFKTEQQKVVALRETLVGEGSTKEN